MFSQAPFLLAPRKGRIGEATMTDVSPPGTRPFSSYTGSLYQNEVECSAFDMGMSFHSLANKNHFHKKGCAF